MCSFFMIIPTVMIIIIIIIGNYGNRSRVEHYSLIIVLWAKHSLVETNAFEYFSYFLHSTYFYL